jgi:general secretion pathway protein A
MYESFYGLTGKPFQLSPDPAFLYASKGHKRAFAYLQYGLYQGEGFIVITGEVGAGKTMLVRTLFEQLDSRQLVAAQLSNTQLDAEDLLRAVATAFGIPVRSADKARVIAELEAYLLGLVSQQKRALLIVDEAQNLTPRAIEELRMLSNFQIGDRALLQSFLIGQPELREMMRSPNMQQLRQRVIAAYHLGPLDKDETSAYIEHRLTWVGWKQDPTFSADAIDAIYSFTTGIPRRINMLCNRVMLAGFLGESHAFHASDIESVVHELDEEAGLDLVPTPPQPRLEEVPLTGSDESSGLRAAPQDDAAGQEPALAKKRSGDAIRLRDPTLKRVEERLARLEKTMGVALDLLRALVSREKSLKRGGEGS